MPPKIGKNKIGKNEERAADDAHSIAARRKAPAGPDALGKPDQAAPPKEQGEPKTHDKAGKSTSGRRA